MHPSSYFYLINQYNTLNLKEETTKFDRKVHVDFYYLNSITIIFCLRCILILNRH